MGTIRTYCAFLLLVGVILSPCVTGTPPAEAVSTDVEGDPAAQHEAEPIILSDDSCNSAQSSSVAAVSDESSSAQMDTASLEAEVAPEQYCGVQDDLDGDNDDTGGWSTDWLECEWCVDALPPKAHQIERVRAEDMTLERFQQEFEVLYCTNHLHQHTSLWI